MVPPVPTPATSASIVPSVSAQSSSAVVLRWISGFAGLRNCWGMKASGSSPAISLALSMAPCMRFAPSVSTSFAPKARRVTRRSTLKVSGITRMHG